MTSTSRITVKLSGRPCAPLTRSVISNLSWDRWTLSSTRLGCRTSARRWESTQHGSGSAKDSTVHGRMRLAWTQPRSLELTRCGKLWGFTCQIHPGDTSCPSEQGSLFVRPPRFSLDLRLPVICNCLARGTLPSAHQFQHALDTPLR